MPTVSTKKSTRTAKKSTTKAKPARVSTTKKSSTRSKETAAVPAKSAPTKKKRATKRATTRAVTKPTSRQLKSYSIVETSPVAWLQQTNGPSFEQVQIAAYHRWLQSGGNDLDNWLSAEGDANGRKDS